MTIKDVKAGLKANAMKWYLAGYLTRDEYHKAILRIEEL